MQNHMVDDIEVVVGSGNVYADLGLPDAEEMFCKAQLVTKIAETIKSRQWTQEQAADVLSLTQSTFSKMLRGQFSDISQAKLLDCPYTFGP
jgi:predicted XRE-type DNA-binding protein